MKSCFIKESKNGIKALFNVFLILAIMIWPIVVAIYMIFISCPIQNPATYDQAMERLNWVMSNWMIYYFIAAVATVIYNVVVGIPLIKCYILED